MQDDAEFTEGLIEAEELEDDLLDEILAEPDEAEAAGVPRTIDRQKLREEIDILQRLADWARSSTLRPPNAQATAREIDVLQQ